MEGDGGDALVVEVIALGEVFFVDDGAMVAAFGAHEEDIGGVIIGEFFGD